MKPIVTMDIMRVKILTTRAVATAGLLPTWNVVLIQIYNPGKLKIVGAHVLHISASIKGIT